jgi:hypothetical protein
VEAPGADEVEAMNFMTGVIVTPATFPVMAAFSFLLVVPRAALVAFAFAEAATRASVDRGLGDFLGWTSKAASIVGELL